MHIPLLYVPELYPPIPEPKKTRIAMSNIHIPSFSGTEDFNQWLNKYDQAMLILGCDEEDAKVAKLFRTCLTDGSTAAAWYAEQSDAVKKAWTLLLPLLKAKFEKSSFTKTQALHAFSGLRCADVDVGVMGEKNTEKQITFANKLVQLASKAGLDDSTTAALALDHMGDELRAMVLSKNPTSVQEIQATILHLTPSDIRKIRKDVRREAEIAQLRSIDNRREAEIAQLRSQLQQRPLAPSAPSRFNNNAPQTQQQSNPAVSYSTGPFPNTPDGWSQYRQACESFYAKYGEGALSGITKPFPLTPGSLPTGSGECWACGTIGHSKPECKNDVKLPPNEQRYRSLSTLHGRPSASPAPQQNTKPWRMMSYEPSPYETPYDTPPTASPTLYSPTPYDIDPSQQGNGSEPRW
jgi:hypothetical protein